MCRRDDQRQKGRATLLRGLHNVVKRSSCHRDTSSAQPFQPRIFSSLAIGTFALAKSSSYGHGGSSVSFLTYTRRQLSFLQFTVDPMEETELTTKLRDSPSSL
ncbi:uncharacterized protein LOC115694624 [Syzygium oleosum]|uniref:uncharacterized protein LOC115694624 n=1 Tax=Syzygium oleosum TaxID=219896 RepID=UPI0024B8A235|nr:uncharacterized protein LOC115694624 [Syzygium oleosum]